MPKKAEYPLALRLTTEVSTSAQLRAAVCAGAQSVCLTYNSQNDKKSPGAFTVTQLHDVLRFCRERGAKVFVCLRRHYTQADIPALIRVLTELNACCVDALRIGDLGTACLVRRIMPHMPIHALNGICLENEMTGFLADRLGFDRVCLSASASLFRLKPHAGIEYEATVFDPGCSSVAGQCTLARFGSAPLDRELPCPAPCKLPHSGAGREYALCPGAISLIHSLPLLPSLGVGSVYLDCRSLRDQETAGIVTIFRNALDAPTESTDAEKTARLLLVKQTVSGFLTEESADALFTSAPPAQRSMDLLETVRQAAARPYDPPTLKSVDVVFRVIARSGEPLTVTVMDKDGNPVSVEGSTVYNTDRQSSSEAPLKTLMYQTGTTPYNCVNVKMTVEKGCRVDDAELSRLRDRALVLLTALRGDRTVTPVHPYEPEPFVPAKAAPRVAVQLSDRTQLSPQLLQLDIACVYLPLSEAVSQDSTYRRMIADTKIELCAVMPQAPHSELIPNLKAQLTLASELGIHTVLCGDAGSACVAISLGFQPRGDWGLWAGNTLALEQLRELGFISCVIGFDTPPEQIKSISHVIETEVYAYGRLPLHVTPVCPLGKEKCSTGKCDLYNSSRETYPVRRDGIGSRCTVYSAKKLVAGRPEKLMALGADMVRLRFVGENARECFTVTQQFLNNQLTMPNDFTTGHYEQPKRSLLSRLRRGLRT